MREDVEAILDELNKAEDAETEKATSIHDAMAAARLIMLGREVIGFTAAVLRRGLTEPEERKPEGGMPDEVKDALRRMGVPDDMLEHAEFIDMGVIRR